MPLNSGDPSDRPLMAGGTYKVIFASNSKDKITVKHNKQNFGNNHPVESSAVTSLTEPAGR